MKRRTTLGCNRSTFTVIFSPTLNGISESAKIFAVFSKISNFLSPTFSKTSASTTSLTERGSKKISFFESVTGDLICEIRLERTKLKVLGIFILFTIKI